MPIKCIEFLLRKALKDFLDAKYHFTLKKQKKFRKLFSYSKDHILRIIFYILKCNYNYTK